MSDLRKNYKKKTVKVADLRSKVDSEDTMLGSGGSREDYLELVEGKTNKIRFFPPHEGPDFYMMRKRVWMKVEDENGDEKNKVFHNSILHNGTKKDIIEEYVNFVNKNVKDAKKVELVNHWKTGLKFQIDFVAYALKISGEKREFGLFSFKKKLRDEFNKLIFVSDDEDEPIEVDPYTDVDDGMPVLITIEKKKLKGNKTENVYAVTMGKKSVPITDEELEYFDSVTPLTELFRNNYKMRDFENSLEALRYYDSENEIDVFEDEEFEEIIESVRAQYDSDDEDEDEDTSKKKNKKKISEKKEVKKSPKKSSKVEDDDEEEEEEEEEAPKSRKKISKVQDDDDDDDDDDDEDDEDEEPTPKKSAKKTSKKPVVDEDDDDEDEDEDEDESPKSKKKMSLSDIRKKLNKK